MRLLDANIINSGRRENSDMPDRVFLHPYGSFELTTRRKVFGLLESIISLFFRSMKFADKEDDNR